MGADIASACGQLVVEQEKKNADIEDGPFAKTTKNATPKKQVIKRTKSTAKDSTHNTVSSEHDKDVNEYQKEYDIDRLIKRLSIATTVAASCFFLSAAIHFVRRQKR